MARAPSSTGIGLIAPAGPPLDAARLERGVRMLEARGARVLRFRPAFPTTGYLAGTDEDRLAELHAAMEHPEVDILLCARGGYGTLRLLDRIDYTLAARHRKVLVGYSDITALQCALHHKAGWRGLSGPMAGVEWHAPEPAWEDPFWQLLSGEDNLRLTPADGSRPVVLRPGIAEGRLIGGNLSVLTRLIGTPYLPSLDGALLFLEDVGEPPYRIDGMLAHLRLAGLLQGLAGVVLGAFTGADVPDDRPSFTVSEVLSSYFDGAAYPVVTNWNYGHFPTKVTMPFGVRGRLEAGDDGTALHLIEPLR